MRRWGPCPGSRPAQYGHGLYVDNKTMLDNLEGDSAFAYIVNGAVVSGPVATQDLPGIEAVILTALTAVRSGQGTVESSTTARVAR
jgi:hypothetical protein